MKESQTARLSARLIKAAGLLVLICSSVARAATSADDKANALLAKMTLDEKIGQMVQVDMAALKDRTDVQKYFLGSVLSGGGSDPADNRPATWLQAVKQIRAQALGTCLTTPLLDGSAAVHAP